MTSATDVFAHRRGLMLGLTLAEVLMLVLFILLMTYTAIVLQREQEIEQVEEKLEVAQQEIDSLDLQVSDGINSLLAEITNSGVDIESSSDLFDRLQEISGDIERVRSDNDKYSKLISSADVAERLAERLEDEEVFVSAEEIIEERIEDSTGIEDDIVPLDDMSMDEARAEIERLRSQNKFIREKAEEEGNGLSYPSCWSRDGKIVYMYNIDVLDNGLRVNAGDDRSGMDLGVFKTSGPEPALRQPLSVRQFQDRTRGVFDWSVVEECRFYVRLMDRTAASNKDGYLDGRRGVESRFYIFDSRR